MLACYIVQAAGLSQFLSPPFMQLQCVCLSVRKLIPSAPSFSVAFTHTTQLDWCLTTSFAHQPCFCHLHQAHCSPPLLRSISRCAYATHQAVSFLNRLFFVPTLKIKNSARPLCILQRSSPVASCRRNSSSPPFSQLAVGSRAQLRKTLRRASCFLVFFQRWLKAVFPFLFWADYQSFCIDFKVCS